MNKAQVDEQAARELELFIENDGDLYRQQYLPIIKNLVAKIDRGIYDSEKAVKLFLYLMESGSKSYSRQFASLSDWSRIFSKATREVVARRFVKHFETEYKLGAYNEFHAKKYQAKRGALSNPAGRVTAMPRNVIAHALDRLNAVYGRGDVVRIDWKNKKVYCKKQYGQDVVSFKVIGNTVYFRGHQMSIGGGVGLHNPAKRELSVPEKHQLRIARDTLRMNDAMARVMGGMSKEEAREIIYRLTGKRVNENPVDYSGIFKIVNVKYADPGSGHGGPKARGIIADVNIDGDTKQITFWRDVSDKYDWITEIYHGYGKGQSGFTKSNAYIEGKGLPAKYHTLVSKLRLMWSQHFKSKY